MHPPKWRSISRQDVFLEMRAVCQDFGAVEASYRERLLEGCLRSQTVIDTPGFEEAGAVGGELQSGLDVLVLWIWMEKRTYANFSELAYSFEDCDAVGWVGGFGRDGC
jgi:hypothetical protein